MRVRLKNMPENLAAWADKLKNMSKPAVQELSKEVRYKMEMGELSGGVNLNLFEGSSSGNLASGSEKSANCKTTPCAAAPQHIKIDLEGELFFMFLKLKKKYGENLSNREVMKKIFEKNLGEEKIEVSQSVKVIHGDNFSCQENKSLAANFECTNQPTKKKSRYFSVRLRRSSLQKTAGKCSYPGCNRPPQIFHHTDRFANSQNHESLTPICKIHHEFAHNGLIKNEKFAIHEWQLQLQNTELDKIDQLYREYRKNNF